MSDVVPNEVNSSPLKSRKFLLVAFILISNTLAFLLGRYLKIEVLSESAYVSLITLIFTGYITANVTQKATLKNASP